jgi:serine/threonine protein kinase
VSNEPLQTGQRIGNYLLQQEIGRGAFAVVWKAVHHERPARTVALKIATHPDYRRQLAREGRLPEIDHPNVVPILDCDTRFTDHPYIVTPFYANGSLADLIAQHPHGLPEARVESLLKDILAGLSAAHQQGIVHRDIKPANILLDDTGRAVIADFGLSLSNGNPDARQSLMQSLSLQRETTGTLAGTLAYMAPEVLSGSQATTAADVYSVGILLFEMLTGRRPAGIELPSRVRAELRRSQQFDALYSWCCRHADERCPDAGTLSHAIEHGASPALGGLRLSPAASRFNAARWLPLALALVLNLIRPLPARVAGLISNLGNWLSMLIAQEGATNSPLKKPIVHAARRLGQGTAWGHDGTKPRRQRSNHRCRRPERRINHAKTAQAEAFPSV